MIFTIIVFFIVLSILVLIHECGHFIAAKKNGVKVEEFGFGLPPRLFGVRRGETLYSLNLLPFGGFVKVFGEEASEVSDKKLSETDKARSFVHKKPLQKTIILTAGVLANFLLGWVIITYLFVKGIPAPSKTITVEKVIENTPAYAAGIKPQDVIVSISNPSKTIVVDELGDISTATKEFAAQNVNITLKRGSETLTVNAVPRQNPPKNEGSLGIVITNYTIKKYPIWSAPFYGLVEAVATTAMILKELGVALFKFVTLQGAGIQVAGPVGIAKLTGTAARTSLDALLQLIGILSLNLAVINILPFPALDGGRLAFVIYETVFKKKINPNTEQKLNFAGFAILIGLILLVTAHDIISLIK